MTRTGVWGTGQSFGDLDLPGKAMLSMWMPGQMKQSFKLKKIIT